MIKLSDLRGWQKVILEKLCAEFDKTIKKDNLKEVKMILNRTFGEQYNQLNKPTPQWLVEKLSEILDVSHLPSEPSAFERYVSQNYMYNEVIVHFPEIRIKNSEGLSHDIKDLYVKFKLTNDGRYMHPGTIWGLRTTMTPQEYDSQYQHSHLRGFSPGRITFAQFCTGSGPINQSMAESARKFHMPSFQMFCLNLKAFVAWESTEGTPYMYMRTIASTSRLITAGRYPTAEAEAVTLTLMKELLKKSNVDIRKLVKIKLGVTSIQVDKTEELEMFFAELLRKPDLWNGRIKEISQHNPNALLAYKNAVGVYYSVAPTTEGARSRPYQKTPILTFKKEEKFFQLTNNFTSNNKLYANPQFTNRVCERLSLQLTKAAINLEGVPTSDTSANKPEIAGSGTLSMPGNR